MVQQTQYAAQPQGLPALAQHTLPFLGELLWPTFNQRVLRDLCYWQVPSEYSDLHLPLGTVVALKRITSRSQLTLGRVFLLEYTVCAGMLAEQRHQQLGRLTKLAHGQLWLTQGESSEEAGYWLTWQDADFVLYEVTHYVTRGTGTQLVQKTRRRKERTFVETAQYEAQICNGVGVRLHLTDRKQRVYRAELSLPTVQAVARLQCRQLALGSELVATTQEGGQAA